MLWDYKKFLVFFLFRKELKISETIHDMSAYTKLNDGIFHQILYSSDERLREAREILDRLEHRELYRFIGQTKPVKQEETLKVEELASLIYNMLYIIYSTYYRSDRTLKI